MLPNVMKYGEAIGIVAFGAFVISRHEYGLRFALTIVHQQFLLIDGRLQNQDNVVSVKANRILPLKITKAETASHDFH